MWEVVGEPALTRLGLYEPEDRTYGRAEIPFSPMEKRLHANPDVTVWFGKAMHPNGLDWSWYQVWEDRAAIKRTGRVADMIFVHGTGVHSGTLASHSRRYLDAGFRLIVPDLVSHGYSTGLHVYQRHLSAYTEGLHAVLHDVARRDDDSENDGKPRRKAERRTTFMLGLSFGGLVAHMYALHYPHSLREEEQGDDEVPIDGIIGVGPIIEYARSNIKIPWLLQQAIWYGDTYCGLGRVEVIVPHKKCLDKDPKVYKTLVTEDKRSHQGAFRVGHLLCIHFAAEEIQKRAHEIRHPTFVQQGGQDRVACHGAAINFIRDISSTDKRMAIYPVCQHVIYRKAKTEEEDLAGRVACVEDNVEWMCERSLSLSRARQLSIQSELTLYDEGNGSSASGSPPVTPALSEASFDGASSVTSYGGPQTPVTPKFDGEIPLKVMADADGAAFVAAVEKASSVDKSKLDHPLLAKAHHSTLPLLARLCPERKPRSHWRLHEALRPYDINTSRTVESEKA
jgi:alpha-beta hydrolase superfamily lysophospholipase